MSKLVVLNLGKGNLYKGFPDVTVQLGLINDRRATDIQYQINKGMQMRWSLSDQALAQLLDKLNKYQPRAIGLDIYRDGIVDPKYPNLATRFQQDNRLFFVCKVATTDDDGESDGIPPPDRVSRKRLGFSDFVVDDEIIARRQLLYLTPPPKSLCTTEYAFSLQLALHYLDKEGKTSSVTKEGYLQIGDIVFEQLNRHTSGYKKVDASGYQILLNYCSLSSIEKIAEQISLRDVLDEKIPLESVELLKDRIVLIGLSAPTNTNDYWKTPFSSNSKAKQKQIPGVIVQAQMLSQILSAVLDRRPLLWWWSGWMEILWVWGWSLVGGITAWCYLKPLHLGLAVIGILLTLFGLTPTVRLQAQLNLLRLLVEQEEFSTAKALLPQIQSQIDNLPPSRTAVNYRINFAQSLSKMIQNEVQPKDVAKMLAQAVQVAKSLKDQRTESYALGTLGELYEQTGQLSDAKGLTQQALVEAESIDAQDIAYQWHWQMGRILQKQSNIPAATQAYNRAYNALKSLRNDLVAINPDVQFSFRESIEPVYRQYVDLLLQLQENPIQKPDNLVQARQVIESLQLAELDNFFRSPCLLPRVDLDKLVEKEISTAVIYPIILDNRLEIITRLPGQDTIYRKTTKVPKDVLEKAIEQLQKDLPVASREPDVKQLSQQLYDWLIKPIESDLANKGITSLVFVLDGSLRNIPMAILYDQQQQKYLIEKYAISLMPGLQLLAPKSLHNVRLNVLIAGVEQERLIEGKSFSELSNVTQELKQVQSSVKSSKELLNQEFTKANLQNQIQSTPFSVVHLATHGQFSSDIEQTYILTWDSLLKVRELDSLLRARGESRPETIELLVLSACKTATGDKRAALGLAGVAVRAGARSTLATLWTIDDESTSEFMGELYRQLNAGVTKAQALQRAQLAILAKENRPYFWAPYVLLGNWL